MISLFKRSLALALFAAGLLAGLQLPGFVEQYEQQVSSRLAEAKLSLGGFQTVADDFHGGDLAALIEHHRRSRDASFRAEAEVIYQQWKRVAVLNAEQTSLRVSLPKQLWHVLWGGNKEILNSTARNYSNVVPLNTGAVVTGIISGLLLLTVALCGQAVFGLLWRAKSRERNNPSPTNQQITSDAENYSPSSTAVDNHVAPQRQETSSLPKHADVKT